MPRTIVVAIAAVLVTTTAGVLARSEPARAQPAHGQAESAVVPTGVTQEILEQARDYRSWQKFPSYEQKAVLSKGHENAHVVAWYNGVAGPSVRAGGQAYPDGSIIVKENRPKPDAAPAALTVMGKRGGTWYFIRATPDWKVLTKDGRPIAGPEVAACAGCHGEAPNDMVFSK